MSDNTRIIIKQMVYNILGDVAEAVEQCETIEQAVTLIRKLQAEQL